MTCTLKCVILLFRAYMLIYISFYEFNLLLIVSGMFKQFIQLYQDAGLYRIDLSFIVSIFVAVDVHGFVIN